ncbi:class I SAM-dependent DNA methyltransferase [Muricoccus radiodurans]|uniref:class I SAM-dependent DNA methyltransferase n=1 Tax=Muricoccus radiodurans TaxID=2231721 RepID=UPI003CEE7A85
MSGAEDPIHLCLAGRISPEVALARLLLTGAAPDEAAAQVAARRDPGDPRWQRLDALVSARRTELGTVAAMIREAEVSHDPTGSVPEAAVAAIAALFDRAVSHAPEASVAAYSLGDPAILAAGTGEIVAWLDQQGLIGPDRDVLDLGCGIGRIAAALAPRCRSVLGLDVSPRMVEEARRRHGGTSGLRFETTSGLDLAGVAGGFDLLLAVDSFPYLVQAGGPVLARHLDDAARLLRHGGALAILNLSYRGDAALDRADAARWAAAGGWELAVNGASPFTLWDGLAFLLRRP